MATMKKALGAKVKGAALSVAAQKKVNAALKKTLASELKKQGIDPKLAGDVSSHARW